MKENLDFFFNDSYSSEMGLININLGGKLYQEQLYSTRELREESIIGRSKPYFLGVEQKPIEFDLAFAFLNPFDDELKRRISRWLNVNYYREFYFLNNPDYRFFVMPINESILSHNGMNQGYIELTFRTHDAYAYSPEILSKEYDFSTNYYGGMSFEINNTGDVPLEVEMWIESFANGNISLYNRSDNDKEFTIRNIKQGEQIYINHETEDVQTNIPNLYHYDDISTNFLKLPVGSNVLNVHGMCKIQVRYRMKYLMGI